MHIGILGAGQLGRMLALAGLPLDIRCRFFDPTPHSPASHFAEQRVAKYDDMEALARFAEGLDAITWEFENVPVAAARFLAERIPVFPPSFALEQAQDRLSEKNLFAQHGIPVPPFAAVDSRIDLETSVTQTGLPAVLKTRRMGYDGKGQSVLREPEDLPVAWENLGSVPLILEGFVPFEREVSLIAVRGREGEIACYPLLENHHREGILRLTLAPAPNETSPLQMVAEEYISGIMNTLNYVGVLVIEFFQHQGRLLANEMAPRVHNSGHGTIEGAETSQFENHIRAVAGLPLGATTLRGYSAMLNIIGLPPDPAEVLTIPGTHLHFYGKEPRAGRKIGHITLRTDSFPTLLERIHQVWAMLPGEAGLPCPV